MRLKTALYREQSASWPATGRHILATFDDEAIVVYQAYREEIGRFAAEQGRFERGFSFARMSWIKPNFLWMMYRSGWGTKPGQEVVLAITLRRTFFDRVLREAVPSTFDPAAYDSNEQWRAALESSTVRLQWDPDHDPTGAPVERRAIQLGLRGPALTGWDGSELLDVTDISGFVAEQRPHATTSGFEHLLVPAERVYPVSDFATGIRLGLDSP